MKVDELIACLKQMPPDIEVHVVQTCDREDSTNIRYVRHLNEHAGSNPNSVLLLTSATVKHGQAVQHVTVMAEETRGFTIKRVAPK